MAFRTQSTCLTIEGRARLNWVVGDRHGFQTDLLKIKEHGLLSTFIPYFFIKIISGSSGSGNLRFLFNNRFFSISTVE